MAKQYVVTAPYITFKMTDSAGATVVGEMYRGGVLPDNADPDNVQRLVDKKMVAEKGSPEADLLGVPAGTPIPGEPPNVPVTEQTPGHVTPEAHIERAKAAQAAVDAEKTARPRPGTAKG